VAHLERGGAVWVGDGGDERPGGKVEQAAHGVGWRGAARPAPMAACSCLAADQVCDTLHESKRKWTEGE
jgi:hypothetical protein